MIDLFRPYVNDKARMLNHRFHMSCPKCGSPLTGLAAGIHFRSRCTKCSFREQCPDFEQWRTESNRQVDEGVKT